MVANDTHRAALRLCRFLCRAVCRVFASTAPWHGAGLPRAIFSMMSGFLLNVYSNVIHNDPQNQCFDPSVVRIFSYVRSPSKRQSVKSDPATAISTFLTAYRSTDAD